jgi:hypothetical protein
MSLDALAYDGVKTLHRKRALAQYPAIDAAAFPEESIATVSIFRFLAFEIIIEAPLSLKEPVGQVKSSFK